MPLLPSLFRGNRAPSVSSSPDSISPATPASTRTPPRPYRRPLKSTPSPSKDLKVIDYALQPALPLQRPLPRTPDTSPSLDVVVIGADGHRGTPSTPPRHRSRSSSSPTPSKAPLPRSTGRSRSSTLNQSPNRPSPSSGPSPSLQTTPPSLKRRPTALKLQTSNLSLPPESPTAPRSKVSKVLSFIPEVPEETPASKHPPSQDESQNDLEPDTTPGPFQNVPLPWSTVPMASLRSDLGPINFDQLVDYTLKSLTIDNVRLLGPNILTTAASEDARLRAELERLKGKYQATTHQRDRAVSELETQAINGELRSVLRTLGGLKKLTQRCDRLAKQIFICNDQIRQIEIQGEEHIIGALRFAIDNPCSRKRASFQPSKRKTLEFNVEDATGIDPPGSPVHLGSPVSAGKSDSSRRVHFEPLFEHLRTPGSLDSRPTSVATILSLGLGNLGFPIPPSRNDAEGSSDNSPGPQLDSVTATILDEPLTAKPLRPKSLAKAASTNNIHLHRHLDRSVEDRDEAQEITIYPPGHKRSESAPLLGALDLPHTPWMPQLPTATTSSSGGSVGTHTLSTSLSLLDLSFSRQPGTAQLGPTAPLKVKGGRANEKATRTRSMMVCSPGSDAIRRPWRGRDTQLETVSDSRTRGDYH